jgi:hypothetical protein
MIRRTFALALVSAATVAAATDHADGRSTDCRTKACKRRTCKSDACHRRVAAKIRARRPQAVISSADRFWLARVRQCESTNNYTAYNPNGPFYGAYQFTLSSWSAVGGSGDPRNASEHEQDMRALKLRALQGTGAWPNCG